MPITVELPAALQAYAAGRAVELPDAECATVAAALAALAARHPGVVDRVLDERGELRRHVNLFADGRNVRFAEGLATPLAPNGTLVVVPAVSGG